MKRVSILIDYLLYFCLTFDIRRCVLIKILISYFSAEEILTLRPFQKKIEPYILLKRSQQTTESKVVIGLHSYHFSLIFYTEIALTAVSCC